MTQKQKALLIRHPLTALNLATTARYRGCIAAGGHRFSGKTLLRDRGMGHLGTQSVLMHVCDRCDVPVVGKNPMVVA